MEKQEAMVAAFGTKRAKQVVSRKLQYKVDATNMSDAIDQAAKSATTKTTDELQHELQSQDDSLQHLLPCCNKQATTIQEVYPLHKLAPKRFLDHLEEPANNILNHNNHMESLCPLVKELICGIQLESNDKTRLKLCTVCVYIQHLHTFLRLTGKELKKEVEEEEPLKGCPRVITQYILRQYSVGKGKYRCRSSSHEDKVMCVIIILSFIINKYQLFTETLLQSLPINKQRLDIIMKVIGARYSPTNRIYTLKLPLVNIVRKYKVMGNDKKRRGKV
ncbi:hypothetical protein Pcinc_026823 [Petrolisthes cinctipes]|uniref:Uncharacterized protein n=1 Tax=Petrolisthes cinctipes TaxID=88211 RepID=A0AAE1KB42_PETCI|nr:hypothetical protein Pcinc_026823 [Petrolisthes cinctipes]